jgi:hypothetical protein
MLDDLKFVWFEANPADLPRNSVKLSHIAKTIRKDDISRIGLDYTGVTSLGDAVVSPLIDAASKDNKLRYQTMTGLIVDGCVNGYFQSRHRSVRL